MDKQEMIEFLQQSRGVNQLDHQLLSDASRKYLQLIEPYLMEDSIYSSLEVALLGCRNSNSETLRFYSSCFWQLNKGKTFITKANKTNLLLQEAA
jgi:hypothetical protein